jgi:ELWxxDGT repeat protein
MQKKYFFSLILSLFLSFCGFAQAQFHLVQDVRVGAQGSEPLDFLLHNNKILFEGRINDTLDGLFASDGINPAVELLRYRPAFDIHGMGVGFYTAQKAVVNGKILFDFAFEPANDLYLTYATDGTPSGTVRLNNMPRTPSLSNFYVQNNVLYFLADNGGEAQLWRTDATDAGTFLIKTFCNLATSNNFCGIINSFQAYKVNATQFMFLLQDNVNGAEPWISDGTAAGTFVINIAPGRLDASVGQAGGAWLNNKAYFQAENATSGLELFATDGTAAGTTLVKNINTTTGTNYHNVNSRPFDFFSTNDKIYFKADNGIVGDEIWVSDGTAAGTKLLLETQAGLTTRGDNARYFEYNGKVLFQSSLQEFPLKYNLYSTDGTPAGTTLLSNAQYDYDLFVPQIVYQNKLYFMAKAFNKGTELWQTDGTAAGTFKIKTISTQQPNNAIVFYNKVKPIAAFGKFYFLANDANDTDFGALWESDGTAAGTKKVATTGVNSGSLCNISGMVGLNGAIYFSGNFNGLGYELWRYAPTVSTETPAQTADTRVFPNPAYTQITVETTAEGSAQLLNILGQTVWTQEIESGSTNINIQHLPAGAYFFELKHKHLPAYIQKIIVQ